MSEVMKLYPSGFLGSAEVVMTEPLSTQEIGRHMFDVITTRDLDQYTASRDVAKLWEDYLSGAAKPNTFDFIQDVLAVAKRAFGTGDFLAWIDAQKSSPFLTEDHAAWIEDTVNHIYGDKPRKYHYNVWERLINLGTQIRVDVRGPAVRKYLVNGNRDTSIEAVLVQWVKRGGVVEVLSSLYVLFGRR